MRGETRRKGGLRDRRGRRRRVTSSSSWLRLKHHLRTDVACRERESRCESGEERREGESAKQGAIGGKSGSRGGREGGGLCLMHSDA